jgi:hypothetical protein
MKMMIFQKFEGGVVVSIPSASDYICCYPGHSLSFFSRADNPVIE